MTAIESRSCGRLRISSERPRPTSPITFSGGTATSSKNSSAVSCPLRPILSSLRPRVKPSAPDGTASSESPSPVRAATITRSAWMPEDTNVFEPLRRYSEPSHFAVAAIARRSDPVPGSVMAIAGTVSPVVTPGSQRPRCSALVRSCR